MTVEVDVLGYPPLLVRMVRVSVDVKKNFKKNDRAQVVCDSRGGCPGLRVPNSLHGLCGR